MNILDTKGKSRAITIPTDVKQLWEQIQHILRNPVIRRYAFPSDIHLEKKAGITALCEYSLLSDNDYPLWGDKKRIDFLPLPLTNIIS